MIDAARAEILIKGSLGEHFSCSKAEGDIPGQGAPPDKAERVPFPKGQIVDDPGAGILRVKRGRASHTGPGDSLQMLPYPGTLLLTWQCHE